MVPLCSEKFVCCCSGRYWCMLPSRCMLPSLRSAPSANLPPLYVPVSPVAAPPRFKPCPVALVPTLGCPRPPTRNPHLLKFALSGCIIPEHIFISKTKRSLHFADTSSYPAREEAPAHPDAFARASTSAGPRGGKAAFLPCLHPCPRTHGEIRGRKGPGRRSCDSHTSWK